MSDIRADATVFIFFSSPSDSRGRLWVSATETQRNNRGDLILVPILNAEAGNAKPWRYDMALIAARRFSTEGFVPSKYQPHFTLQASDSDREISFAVAPATREDKRVPMHYKGLLAVPGRDVRSGEECFWVRFPNQGIESIRGSTPEEVIDRVYEMNLQSKAEKYEGPPPAPEPPAPQPKRKFNGRVRPGDLQ